MWDKKERKEFEERLGRIKGMGMERRIKEMVRETENNGKEEGQGFKGGGMKSVRRRKRRQGMA